MESPKIHRVLVYTDKEVIAWWWTFGTMSPTPQSAWDVPQKAKKRGQKNTVCFTVELEKKTLHRTIFLAKFSYVRVLLIDGGAVKKIVGRITRNNESNDLEPHFPTSATKSRCLEDTKIAVALPHCSESTKESIAGWWTFGFLEVRLGGYGGSTERCTVKKW